LRTLTQYRRNLPHLRLEGAVYFVTWRLDSSQSALTETERGIVRDALLFADGSAFDLLVYVVMDDHVHVLVRPKKELQKVIHSWKSFTTHEFHCTTGRVGRVWQFEYFDRIVRDEAELAQKWRYIEGNPWKRWPGIERYEWVGEGRGTAFLG